MPECAGKSLHNHPKQPNIRGLSRYAPTSVHTHLHRFMRAQNSNCNPNMRTCDTPRYGDVLLLGPARFLRLEPPCPGPCPRAWPSAARPSATCADVPCTAATVAAPIVDADAASPAPPSPPAGLSSLRPHASVPPSSCVIWPEAAAGTVTVSGLLCCAAAPPSPALPAPNACREAGKAAATAPLPDVTGALAPWAGA